jgi:Tfp pilus assembly protein PilF
VLAAEGKLEPAQKELERAIKLDPNMFQAHLQLSMVLLKSGNVAEARLHCQKAAQSPDSDLRNTALSLLRQMGR